LRCVTIYLICTSSLVFSWSAETTSNEKKSSLMDRRSAMIASSSSIATFAAWTKTMSLPVEAMDVVAPPPTTTIPSWNLEGDVKMPTLALNTAGLSMEGTENAVALAYKNGITHIDFHPGRERDGVAKHLADTGGKSRSELFLNTKIRIAPKGINPIDATYRVRRQIQEDLDILNIKSADMLMLRDSPDA